MQVLTWWETWGELVRTILVGISSVAVAYVGAMEKRRKKDAEETAKAIEKAVENRSKEARLQMQMILANIKLTVGVAMALKHGHCNGEVEAGLEAVKDAEKAYTGFIQGVGFDEIMKFHGAS